MKAKVQLSGMMLLIAGFLLLVGDFATAQNPNPMFSRRDHRMTNPYSDVVALRPGDLLVVLINEQSDVENRDLRRLNKQGNSSLSASFNYGLTGGVGGSVGGASFDEATDAERRFDGQSRFESERGYKDRFTVTVVDILPNGNLLLSGSRRVIIEGDERTLVLTGTVRKFDISPRNTVLSQNVADLKIGYESKSDGSSENSFINQGWLARRINRWWPN